MSNLAEIEAAVVSLPLADQRALLERLNGRVAASAEPIASDEPSLDELIGFLAGPKEPTGRRAEEILYGRE